MSYLHLAQKVYNTPHMLSPDKLAVILRVWQERTGMPGLSVPAQINGETEKERTERRGVSMEMAPVFTGQMAMFDTVSTEPDAQEQQAGTIAVISITGTLVNRMAMEPASSFASYERIKRLVQVAANDPGVKGILLRIESFGGEVSGAFDAADVIRAAGQKKPVWAVADDNAASAAYLLASQAERVFVTRTSYVGSVGVIAVHYDLSKMEEQDGIKPTAIFAGSKKNWFTPDEPLDDEAAAWLKSEVMSGYDRFVKYVADARGMAPKAVRGTEAGIYRGQDAVAVGFADKIGTFETALSEMASAIRKGKTKSSMAASVAVPQHEEVHMDEPQADAAKPAAPVEVPQPAAAPVAQPEPQPAPAAVTENDARQIATLCIIAGKKDLAADFIAKGASVADVSRFLLDAAAQSSGDEILTGVVPTTSAKADEKTSPLVKAVEKLKEQSA